MLRDQSQFHSHARRVSDSSNGCTAAEKKRARDRRAQQNLRNKRAANIKSLEERIATLQDELHRFQSACQCLPRANTTLCALQGDENHTVELCPADLRKGHRAQDDQAMPPFDTSDISTKYLPRAIIVRSREASMPSTDDSAKAGGAESVAQILESRHFGDLILPQWNLRPAHHETDIVVTDCFSLWLSRPELVTDSPASPSPLELLYGSKRNLLANMIYESIQKWPTRDPERLAGGWLAYHLIKWLVQTNETNFSNLQNFQKPVAEQLCLPHPYFIDFLVWPQLRTNLVKLQRNINPAEVMGMLTCCLRVKWPWNQQILEPNSDGNLQMRADFYDTFRQPGGWGLTEQFIEKYPSLVQDLDIPSLQFTFT